MEVVKTYYYSWVRKGLSSKITEPDLLGDLQNTDSLVLHRSKLTVTSKFNITNVNKEKDISQRSEAKEINFVGPGDILKINPKAIIKVAPSVNNATFPIDFLPYIEFYEADFLWRYTPAMAQGEKLRPWLALLVCKTNQFTLDNSSQEKPFITLNINSDEEYKAIFMSPKETWKTAHAEGSAGEPEFSRLLAMRGSKLEHETDYTALLIPLFETGRLRGLGYDDEAMGLIVAQASSWETSLALQKEKHPRRPLDFPVYYHWKFRTGKESFDVLAQKLTAQKTAGLPADIQVDVTDMGEGLSYSQLPSADGARNRLGVSVATLPLNYKREIEFPSSQNGTAEKELHQRMKELIANNPVFVENQSEATGNANQGTQIGDDDPWVTPPVYGAKHAMATSISQEQNNTNNTPWITELNMDIGNRTAAGLGKKIVQNNQEEFVNRAWKQVEAITALNQELRQRLMSSYTEETLVNKYMKGVNEKNGSQYIALLMKYLDSMKYAETNNKNSLAKALNDSNIPLSFASAAFHQLTGRIDAIDETTLMEQIASEQIFRMKEHSFFNQTSLEQMKNLLGQKNEILKLFYEKRIRPLCSAEVKKYSSYFNLGKETTNADKYLDINQLIKNKFPYQNRKITISDRGIGLEITDFHLSYWHKYFMYQYFIPAAQSNSIYKINNYEEFVLYNSPYLLTNSIFKCIDDFFNAPLYARSNFNFGGSANAQGKNVIAIDDEEYNTLFGESSAFCTKIGEMYFVPRGERFKEKIKKNEIIAKIKIPFIIAPIIKHHYTDYGHKIVAFKLYWQETETCHRWNFEPQNDKDYSVSFDYDPVDSNNLNDLFITIKTKKNVVESLFEDSERDNDFVKYNVDFFKYPVKTEGEYYVIKYRLSSYYHPMLWPFKDKPEAEEKNLNGKTTCGPGFKLTNKEIELDNKSTFGRNGRSPALQGFHYPQGCFGYWMKKEENEREWDNFIEFIVITIKYNINYFFKSDFDFNSIRYPYSINYGLSNSFSNSRYLVSHDDYSNKNRNLTYWRIRDNFLFIADPLSFEKLFTYYVDNESSRNSKFLENDDYKISNYPFNENTMQLHYKKSSWDVPNKYGVNKVLTVSNYNEVQSKVKTYAELKQKAVDFLFTTPDHFEFKPDNLKTPKAEKDYQEFDSLIDFILKSNEKLKVEIQAYNNLIKIFDKIDLVVNSNNINVLQPEPAAATLNSEIANDIKQSILKNEGYNRMLEVASTYYGQFFGQSPDPVNLQEKYIDDLMHSKYPIMAYPIFPEPAYYYLREMSEKFILPCVEQLPVDSIALFKSNASFEEAYLCGMNTEMGKELLWREYPTDQRGSYFRKFWDSETDADDINNNNFFDIKPIHHWKNPLGENHLESKTSMLIFAVKGNLIRQYPSTQIFLRKAKLMQVSNTENRVIMNETDTSATTMMPTLSAWVSEDVFLVGFKTELKDVVGNLNRSDYGYFLAFKEDMLDINFTAFNDGEQLPTASHYAAALVNTPSLYGKHLSLFV